MDRHRAPTLPQLGEVQPKEQAIRMMMLRSKAGMRVSSRSVDVRGLLGS